jgi:hypothetical protein
MVEQNLGGHDREAVVARENYGLAASTGERGMQINAGRTLAALAALGMACLLVSAPASAATLFGDTLFFEDGVVFSGTVSAHNFTPASGGVFGPFVVRHTPTSINFGGFNISITDDSIAYTSFSNFMFVDFPFNGFVLIDRTRPITDESLIFNNIPGFISDDIQIHDGAIWIDMATLIFHPSYGATITFGTSRPVPEPAAWRVMLLGFTLLGVTVRRSRAAARPRAHRAGGFPPIADIRCRRRFS